MLFVVRKTRLWPLLGLVLAAGCKKNATETAAPADGGGATQHEPRTLESLESELAERNAELHADTSATAAATTADADEGTRCERACSIKTTICSLADSICGLANEHPDEARYLEACERAHADCERASEACDGCED